MLDRLMDRPSAPQKVFLICRCVSARRIAVNAQKLLAAAADRAGVAVDYVDDFCVAACRAQTPLFSTPAAESPPPVVLLACSRRAVEALRRFAEERAGAAFPPIFSRNLADEPPEDVLRALELDAAPPDADAAAPPAEIPEDASAPAAARDPTAASAANTDWFPVIDRERCVNCGQCAQFCLFGVYRADSGGIVRVVRPFSCKNQCPACARVCPRRAVIFPKHADPAINGSLEADAVSPGTASPSPAGEAENSLGEKLAARRRKARKRLFNDLPPEDGGAP